MSQYEYRKFFINGEWIEPDEPRELAVINPATEQPAGVISLGNARDVDRAVAAAREAFPAWSRSGKQKRLALIDAFIAAYKVRYNDMAAAITAEMGAPRKLSTKAQAAMGVVIAKTARLLLEDFDFEEQRGATLIRREPIGVCGFITPWNWPVNQIALKVLPALASGCTMVLKPSEIAPFSGAIFAEVMEAAEVPAGVFNLVNGDGPGVGHEAQFNKVQHLIQQGIDEGAELAAGGVGRPEGLERGYYVRPTVFAKVRNDMAVAREEIFGPVLCVIPYRGLEDALAIANDTEYGLAAYVWGSDLSQAREVAARLRAGQVSLNGNSDDAAAPFGGYKQSGNGRESGPEGLEEFLETKAILGYEQTA